MALRGAHLELTERIIGQAIDVHRELGPGLLESVYEQCLAIALSDAGLSVEQQVELPIAFRGRVLGAPLRIDLVVEKRVIVEVKSVRSTDPVHEMQLHTYLRLARVDVGLLINFNVTRLVDGVRRVLLEPSQS